MTEKRYSKLIDKSTNEVVVCDNSQKDVFIKQGFVEQEVEQAYNGKWYLKGYAPAEPEKSYAEKRIAEYPAIVEQLDMIYWDGVNGTTNWQDKIAEIKLKYPKIKKFN